MDLEKNSLFIYIFNLNFISLLTIMNLFLG